MNVSDTVSGVVKAGNTVAADFTMTGGSISDSYHGFIVESNGHSDAEFDNVVVTSGHRTPLYSIDILSGSDCERFTEERLLRQTGTPAWDCTDYEAGYLRQASLDGVARDDVPAALLAGCGGDVVLSPT